MQERFGVPVGLSDHTLDNTTYITSVALGRCIIENHVTLDRRGGGPDDGFLLEFEELKALCKGVKIAWEALGDVDYGRKSSEKNNAKFRRSIYFVKDMKAGEEITKEAIRRIRPDYGLPPKFESQLIGRTLKKDVQIGTATSWDLISD